MNPPLLLGLLGDGAMWMEYHSFELPTGAQFVDQPLQLVRFSPAGEMIDTVDTFRYGLLRVIDAEAHFVGGPLFEARQAVTARGDWTYRGHGEKPEIEVRNVLWQLRRLIRWGIPDRTIPAEDLAEYWAELIDASTDPLMRRLAERRKELTPVADEYPAFQELQVDASGTLWVKRYPRLRSGVRGWLAFDAAGRFVCQAILPDALLPMEFGEDHVIGRHRDDLGVERVVQYRLALIPA